MSTDTNRKLGSGYSLKIFSPLREASTAGEQNERKTLKNDEVQAKSVNRPLIGSLGRLIICE
jgi:hypothetical protein